MNIYMVTFKSKILMFEDLSDNNSIQQKYCERSLLRLLILITVYYFPASSDFTCFILFLFEETTIITVSFEFEFVLPYECFFLHLYHNTIEIIFIKIIPFKVYKITSKLVDRNGFL